MKTMSKIDELLAQAVTAGDVPGVVATAGTADGVVYEGCAGVRSTATGVAMTIDTVHFLASMTKALTATAALQLVERGRLSLDEPAAQRVPEIARAQVLEGWDEAGRPKLRPPRRPVTLRNLLTHTSGFAYEIWNGDAARWLEHRGLPNILSCRRATLERPLMRDPDTAWEYGVGIDYAGRLVEEVSGETLGAFLRKNLFEPLAMQGTGFRIDVGRRPRLASMHLRRADGGLDPFPFEIDPEAEFDMGGGGAYGTAPDYLRYLRMILNGGTLDGTRVLEAATVDQMTRNQMGPLDVQPLRTVVPAFSNDCDFFPGMACKWGLSFLINPEATAEGRSAGGLSWAGLCNSYYWIDLRKKTAGVIMSQLFPFFDARAVQLFRRFESTLNQVA